MSSRGPRRGADNSARTTGFDLKKEWRSVDTKLRSLMRTLEEAEDVRSVLGRSGNSETSPAARARLSESYNQVSPQSNRPGPRSPNRTTYSAEDSSTHPVQTLQLFL